MAKYNLHSSKVYSIDKIMKEIHSYIQSEEEYTDEQRRLFYERFIDKEQQILECTPKQKSMPLTGRIKEKTREILFIAFLLLVEGFSVFIAIKQYGEETIATWFNRFFWGSIFAVVLSAVVLFIEALASCGFKKYLEKYLIKFQEWINSHDK